MKIEILPIAQQDIRQAAEHYDGERNGLGDEFLAAIEDSVEAIARSPEMFHQVRRGIRCYLVRRFPYGIYYRMPEPDAVRIIVVKHHSRRPGFGMKRN